MEFEKDLKNTNTQTDQQEESSVVCLIIKDLSDVYIRYDVVSSNLVYGIRKFLINIPTVCFITNYDLVVEKNKRKLEDYESIFEVGLEDYDVIVMTPCLYTSNSSEFHLKRLDYILYDYPPFINKTSESDHIIARDLNKLIESSKNYYAILNENRQKYLNSFEKKEPEKKDEGKSESENRDSENKTEQVKEEPKQDKPKERKMEQPTKEQIENELKNLQDLKQKIGDMDFNKFSFVTYPDCIIYEDHPKPQKFRCLNSIFKSIYNQTRKEADKNGDLVYLDVYTLEGTILYVTCSEKGFFVNNSTATSFDHHPNIYPCYSYTLVGLLSQASPLFKENFTKLISQVLNVEPALFEASPNDKFDWLSIHENPFYYGYRFKDFQSEFEGTTYMRLNKEWNEEFQTIIDINFNNDPIQNLTKEKLLNDFYKLFKDTAIEGCKLIRDKKITPFNFFDNPKTNSGYYVYGNIFFTVLSDNYNDFRTYTEDDQRQTYLGSNLDLRHINYLNGIRYTNDLKNFYFSLNCIVQYKGLRIHAQVITPGVIFNSEHLLEYGESEEGLFKSNPEFIEEYKKLCEKLNIREIKINDKNGKEFDIIGHPEIKGIKGVDRRKYLFDLIHLFPRDLNYVGSSDFNGCLLRPELIKEYQMKLIYSKISGEYQEEMKKINEIDNSQLKDEKSYVAYMEEKQKKKEELYERINGEIKPLMVVDTTLHTEHKYFKYVNENAEKDEAMLKDLARFLKEEMLVKFLTDNNKADELAPSDCFSLTDAIHKLGISARYYGELIKLIENDNNLKKNICWLRTLMIRDIIRRSAKHIYNSLSNDIPDYLSKHFTSHFLNLLLSPTSLLKLLDTQEINYSSGQIVTQKNTNQSNQQVTQSQTTLPQPSADKKKKKNKNKKKKVQKNEKDIEIMHLISENLNSKSLFDIPETNKYFIKPSEFWNQIKSIAQTRYGYELNIQTDYIDAAINKFGLLRDICLTLGIQVESVDYQLYFDNLSNKNDFKYSAMPFKADNISDFFPTVKDFKLPSEIHKPIFDQAEAYFKSGNFIDAADKYKQILYLSTEVYGQINNFSSIAQKRLAEIAYLEGDYLTAISLVQKAIVISEKLYNYDNNFVANSYAELSTYYHLIGQEYLAFKHLFRSLEIINFTYPKNHPELSNRISNLAMYYVDLDMLDDAKEVMESSIKLQSNFFEEDDKNMQRGWLLLSHLSLKTYSVSRAIAAYEKYLNALKKNNAKEEILTNGNKILDGLKTLADEYKKKHHLFKNKEDSKKFLEELMKKYVNIMFWEDLEKPFHKLFMENNGQNPFYEYFMKGMNANK